jgi:hypothetical protein
VGITKGDAAGCADPTPMVLSGPVERVEAVVRQDRLLVYTGGARSWRNRWRAGASRKGLSIPGIKQRIKQALVAGAPGGGKYALAKFLDGARSGSRGRLPESLSVRCVEREGLAGILYTVHAHDTEMRLRWERPYRAAVAGNLACLGFLEKLEAILSRERLPVLTLKGASLLQRHYPKMGLRPMEDLDLMVRPEHRCRFAQILTTLGYEANRRRTDRFQGRWLTVDLHLHPLHTERIDNRKVLLPEGIQPIWQNSESWAAGFNWLRRPADVDNLLLLSLHLLKHYYSRLIWIEDIRRMVHRCPEEFQNRLLQRAEALGCTKPMAYSLYVLETLYPKFACANPWVRAWVRAVSPLEKAILLLCIADKPLALAAPILEVLAVRGLRSRMRLALETLFPKRHVRQAEFGAIRPGQRAWFVPRRLIQTLTLLRQNLFTIFRVLGRVITTKCTTPAP